MLVHVHVSNNVDYYMMMHNNLDPEHKRKGTTTTIQKDDGCLSKILFDEKSVFKTM